MSAISYSLYRTGRRITRSKAVSSLIPNTFRRFVQSHLQRRAMERMPDRVHMDRVLLPTVKALNPKLVIDVGVEWYSAHYRTYFDAAEYWTIDQNPEVASNGQGRRHITGDVAELRLHFKAKSADVILLNGVIGFGVNDLDSQEHVIEECRKVLRVGGWMLVGWDRDPNGRPLIFGQADVPAIDPRNLQAIAAGFEHRGPLNSPARTDFTDCSHVYDWFQRVQ